MKKFMVYCIKEDEFDMSNLKENIIKYIKKLTNIHIGENWNTVDFVRKKK